MRRPCALLLGPSREAISGVTTHLNLLLGSKLQSMFELAHFQVGSEGRAESAPGRLARLALSPFALAFAILRRDAAIVHLNTSLNARAYWRDLAYLLVAKLCGARVLLQKHGGTLEEFCRGNALFAAFVRATLRLPDAVAVLSRSELEAYRAFLPARSVTLLANGIDCLPYRKYGRPPPDVRAPLRLLYMGRLASGKGLAEMLEALSLLARQRRPVRLAIAGSGPEEQHLRARAKALELGDALELCGPAYGADKARLLSRADVLLLPSYAEGLPYALLEAMAAGVVPIVTPVGAIPDVVEEGVHGLFVPPRDAEAIAAAAARLAADRAALARMGAACRRRVAAAYSLDRLAADLFSVYSVLCAPRARDAVF